MAVGPFIICRPNFVKNTTNGTYFCVKTLYFTNAMMTLLL